MILQGITDDLVTCQTLAQGGICAQLPDQHGLFGIHQFIINQCRQLFV